jgi:hypothetical protein
VINCASIYPAVMLRPGHRKNRALGPADLGGGSLIGYEVEFVHADDGTPAGALAVDDPGQTSATIMGLNPGDYVAHVVAANEVGVGTAAEQAVHLDPPAGSQPPTPTGSQTTGSQTGGSPSGHTPSTSIAGAHTRRAAVRARVGVFGWHGRRLRLRLGCPANAASRCRITVKIRTRSGKTLNRATFTLSRGRTRTTTVTLSAAKMRQLHRHPAKLRLWIATATSVGTKVATRALARPR